MRQIKIMFSYYGSKSKIVQYYPSPTHDKIIEPFAGSARYSEMYWDTPDILLMDKYQVIVDVWHYLQMASEKDILGLPSQPEKYLSKEENYLIGYCISRGSASPKIKPQKYNSWDKDKVRIANSIYKIKHWKIIQGSYEDIENENATWFIDPPYQFGGQHYKEPNKNIDFNLLANWCKSRLGQVIVCENTKANWMDFKPIIQIQGTLQTFTTEAIWTNFKTQYDSVQQELFSWVG